MKNKIKQIRIDDVELTEDNFIEITGSRRSKTFEEFILDNISERTIIDYVKWHYDMLEDDEVECDCEEQSITDFPDMEEQLRQDGYIVFKPTSVSEFIAIEEKIKNFYNGS